ncbi:hypothetical protein PGT21_003062 [Puccinia graminis f. sp. tritici]|uniref:Uncharacterized protein n=1 Tax=Puccinia graminis f. sp. tritici TaxID=56615 RepID=A0A5B0NM77_PUCGR|nr:hypothetical protein PGT21_003062 [Puccinia graminis f. sp. tritici]
MIEGLTGYNPPRMAYDHPAHQELRPATTQRSGGFAEFAVQPLTHLAASASQVRGHESIAHPIRLPPQMCKNPKSDLSDDLQSSG